MNNKNSLPYLVIVVAPLLSAHLTSLPKENTPSANFVYARYAAKERYRVDKIESVVTWKGSGLINSQMEHTGYVDILKGELVIEKGQLVGGTVEVDMNTIADDFHRKNNKLVSHLKSADFLDVEKFPISTFAITKVASPNEGNVNVTGDLTIKGITHAVIFPAKIEVKDGVVHANGKVSIDRTQWDVRYRSGTFYSDLADSAISDSVEFEMKIVAKK